MSKRLAAVLLCLFLPLSAKALPQLEVLDGFLALAVSDFAAPSGDLVAVDVSVAAGAPLDDVISWDLQVAWDPGYWQLDSIEGATAIGRNDSAGTIRTLFGDVGTGTPIAIGAPLFRLLFLVVGSSDPLRTVLELGDLPASGAVLVADSDFDVASPTPNARILTPEPGTGALLGLGLLILARRRA